jgi:hypothetical protein
MNINPKAYLDRIEGEFFSVLTFIFNKINQIQGYIIPLVNNQKILINIDETDTYLVSGNSIDKKNIHLRSSINQTIITIFIWMILGLATGFLIGMIKPR